MHMEKILKKKIKDRTLSGTVNPAISQRERAHGDIAREAAEGGIVLLKNEEEILPLRKGAKIALYGAGASKTVKGGTGSGDVNERKSISIYEGMAEAGFEITTKEWLEQFDAAYEKARIDWRDKVNEKAKDAGTNEFFDIYSRTPFVIPKCDRITKTDTELAMLVISRNAGEGADRYETEGDYYLTEEEREMLSEICELYEKLIVVVNTGGIIDLSFIEEEKYKKIAGLFYIVQPGQEGGRAFGRLLLGEVSPSGKLTDSWAYRYGDYPNAKTFSHNNQNIEKEIYEEGIYTGYRYFDTFEVPVQFPFGYGLSYTDFAIETQGIEVLYTGKMPRIAVKVSVTNTGSRYSGREVVQVYVSCPAAGMEKEYRRLVGFQKTRMLGPSKKEDITIEFTPYQLASFDGAEPGWVLEEGKYCIWVGNSLNTAVLEGAVSLSEKTMMVRTKHICPVQQEMNELHYPRERALEREREIHKLLIEKGKTSVALDASRIPKEVIAYTGDAKEAGMEAEEAAIKALVDTLTTEQLIKLVIGDPGKGQGSNLGAAGISVPGSAGETSSCALENNIANIVLADGPAGLRLMQYYYVANGEIVNMPFKFSLEKGIFYPEADAAEGTKYYQHCTAIPVGTLLAQTFDTELITKIGACIGKEMEEFGVTLWLAPGMNIHRNPLCGRNFEYYSEDPFLSGKLAAAMTQGVQSIAGCGTTIKHFACNNQEDNRKGSDSIVSERALREIYLKGFEIAVKESKPLSMMTSYNFINGVHAANNYDLCTAAARDEWGFTGAIMTDWTTTNDDATCTAAGCIKAGNDLIMPGENSDFVSIQNELEAGTLTLEELQKCVRHLVKVILRSNRYH